MRGPMILEMSKILEKIDLITTKRNSTFLITFYFYSSIFYFYLFIYLTTDKVRIINIYEYIILKLT